MGKLVESRLVEFEKKTLDYDMLDNHDESPGSYDLRRKVIDIFSKYDMLLAMVSGTDSEGICVGTFGVHEESSARATLDHLLKTIEGGRLLFDEILLRIRPYYIEHWIVLKEGKRMSVQFIYRGKYGEDR